MAAGANRDKIVASAQKFIQRGQLDKAIKEFQRILEEEPKDVRTLLKIGDLYSKKGERDKATETYLKVADFYSDQGFFLKAVAVYKQILKVEPGLVDVQHKLADLYAQLGLTSDALQQYHGVAQHFEKSGELTRTVGVLKRMTELEPANFGSHIKLGEIYAKQNQLPDALAELTAAATHLKQANRLDDYARVIERVLQLQPENAPLTLELAEHYLQRNDVKRALAKLQTAFKGNPRDIPTLEMLARAFAALDQPHKTASIYKELAKIHGEQGDSDKKRQYLKKVLEVSPDDTEVRDELEFRVKGAAPPPARPPLPPPKPSTPVATAAPAKPASVTAKPSELAAAASVAKQMAAQPTAAARPQPVGNAQPAAPLKLATPTSSAARGESLSKLLTETDVYLKYGLRDKALDHLKTIFSIDPDNLEAHVKVHEVYMQSGDTDGAKETLLTMAKIAEKRGDHAHAVEWVQDILRLDPNHEEGKKLLALWSDQEPELLNDDEGVDLVVEDEPPSEDLMLDEPEPPRHVVVKQKPTAPAPVTARAAQEEDLQVDDDLFSADHEKQARGEAALGDFGDEGIEVEVDVTASGRHTLEVSNELDDGLDIDLGPPPADELSLSAPEPEPVRPPPSRPSLAPAPAASVDVLEEDDSGLGIDLDGGHESLGHEPTQPAATRAELAPEDTDAQSAAQEQAALFDEPADETTQEAEAPPADDEPNVDDELEEAEFLEQQGLTDEAQEAYRAVLAKSPKNTKATQRLAAILRADGAASPAADDDLGLDADASPTNSQELSDEQTFVDSPGLSDELEADEGGLDLSRPDDDLGLDDPEPALPPVAVKPVTTTPAAKPATPVASRPVAATLAKAPQAPAVDRDSEKLRAVKAGGETRQLISSDALGGDTFDLMSELADDFADAASSDSTSGDDELQFSAEEVFAEFKKGVAKTVSDKDYATHYDLGIAYKEMGLSDDAIGEFEIAAKAPEKEVEALTMVGVCKTERGDFEGAIAAYKRAASSDRLSPKQMLAVEYELALVYEMKGDQSAAVKLFAKVAKADPTYRDVKEKAAHASDDTAPLPPPDSAGSGARKGKISYL